ncbi:MULTISPECIES: DnaD domain-containing protein [Streptococcus]|uniref:DnaD domain-containing protein n=1 Tax=Streptococcus TaxID=1301 RepID=UPI000277F5F5|nr:MULTISPECIES: DnaD domain-containing protein [Streptococcus]EJO20722.1 replication initiation and membrane attachment protein, DnaB/DnaD family [Streptococcus sp. BS35b]ETS89835.1 replication initiation and membrane attachment protein, DnaB/DnaD family [Streptococcus sp. BS29a]EUB27723.1 replication initiation and membrane attachment protein, DnaB/DnaD family [Streptococcus sp. BS21]
MTYFDAFKTGNLVLPSALLLHFKELFPSSEDFLVWQFFYLQNTTALGDVSPSQIAEIIGKEVADVNQSISNLTENGLLQYRTIELNGEIELIFDASLAFERLDSLLDTQTPATTAPTPKNQLKDLVETFQQELGRLLTPFEIEDLFKTVKEDGIKADLIKEALREAVFNGKPNWKYIQAILRNWCHEGIQSVAQVEAKRAEREANNPKQVQASADFLDAMNLWQD